MDAAIVKLDPLPDPVRSAAKNDDFFALRHGGLVLPLVGGIEIRRVGLEFRRTRVDDLVDRLEALFPSEAADALLVGLP
jgi:hypothetical protein